MVAPLICARCGREIKPGASVMFADPPSSDEPIKVDISVMHLDCLQDAIDTITNTEEEGDVC
jgi:hypothetical protein